MRSVLVRFVLALLLTAVGAPAIAQQAKPAQPSPPAQPAQASPSSKPSTPEEIMRQRILLRERFNKGWDIQPETPQERERRCKSEAKKQFSALHPLKRRRYVKGCVAHGGH